MIRIVKIKKIGINGEGIAYIDSKPCFIKNAKPNDIVKINYSNKDNYYIGEIVEFVSKSKDRLIPRCKYQDRCNCSLMDLSYDKQIQYKKDLLVESLLKYSGIKNIKINNIIKADEIFSYRNQLKMPLKNIGSKLVCGFYEENSNYLIDIDECIVHDEKLESLRKKVLDILNEYNVRAYDKKSKKGLRYLVIRNINDSSQISLISGNDSFDKKMINSIYELETVESIYQFVNTLKTNTIFTSNEKLLIGDSKLRFELYGLSLELSPRSFFQLDLKQTLKIHNLLNKYIKKSNLIVEAYSGMGIISMSIKDKANRFICIDNVNSSISNGKDVVKKNNIDNIEFILNDACLGLKSIKDDIDYLIVDPSRSGLDENMINTILSKNIKNIIYISCNPSTLSKNLFYLKDRYSIKNIDLIDMFPNTSKIECLVHLYLN